MEKAKQGRKPSDRGSHTPSTRARQAIADALCSEVYRWRQPQAKAAARLGIHRSNLNRLLQGKLSRFALGNLIDMAAVAGIEVELVIRDPAPEPAAVGMPALPHCRSVDQSPRNRLNLARVDSLPVGTVPQHG
ncbi:XRE family transcriptional regulator [Sphingomonas sp. ST-64]|uniref:XRE family transcriptional regulator n=1 Tax=Sphingomonas plantiphila TaxID=3163295 RepID=A0ABW8YPU2_9SPHN